MNLDDRIEGCFIGLAVGDALGVPVEFSDRESLKQNPVTDMRGFGTWNQPPGTWSDDSSLAFCTAESLTKGYDLNDIGQSFVKWMNEGYWGAHHKVFDIGNATRQAISKLSSGVDSLHSGNTSNDSNGNGSLMRIAPASIYFHQLNDVELRKKMQEISGITHAHSISVSMCYEFSKMVQLIIAGKEKLVACEKFGRMYQNMPEENIHSSGYVVHTLEASVWSFINSSSYSEAVLKAVNLGEDTDTTACVTGAVAGLYYGVESIPETWRNAIARRDDIILLAKTFAANVKQR
jgi:ADP-ribosyl-[dinitrogen reductase] hydrolase